MTQIDISVRKLQSLTGS